MRTSLQNLTAVNSSRITVTSRLKCFHDSFVLIIIKLAWFWMFPSTILKQFSDVNMFSWMHVLERSFGFMKERTMCRWLSSSSLTMAMLVPHDMSPAAGPRFNDLCPVNMDTKRSILEFCTLHYICKRNAKHRIDFGMLRTTYNIWESCVYISRVILSALIVYYVTYFGHVWHIRWESRCEVGFLRRVWGEVKTLLRIA